MSVKGIIFDFGFTLYYFEDVSVEKYFECFKRGLLKSVNLLKESNVLKDDSILIEKFLKLFRKKKAHFFRKSMKTKEEYPTSYIFRSVLEQTIDNEFVNQLTKEFCTELATIYHSFEEGQWMPFKETKKTLEKLNELDIKLAVLSNHPHHETIKNLLKKYDLLKYFDIITTSAKFGKRKPSSEIFYHTLEKIGLKSEGLSCIMVGDEYADIIGGQRAGLQTILFEREYKFPFEKEIPNSDFHKIKNISEVIDFIK